MSVGRNGSAGAERRRAHERNTIQEGEALWRSKQRHTWINRLQEQREAREMLTSYNPWGRPGGGAPFDEDPRKRKVPDTKGPIIPALHMGRPGGGAPLRTKSGRLQTLLRVDPVLRFQDQAKKMVDIEMRYRSSPTQQTEYKSELDAMVNEKRRTQNELRKGSNQEIRRMGWNSDPNLSAREENPSGLNVNPNYSVNEANCSKYTKLPNIHQGQELAPLLKNRQIDILHSRHPLSSTDVTRFQVPGIAEARGLEDQDLVQTLRRQVIYKQKKLEDLRRREVESCQKHFDTWNKFWGRPGHGAPSHRLLPPKFDLNQFFDTQQDADLALDEPIK